MSVRKEISGTSGLYFITFTCCKWLPLFELVNAYDEMYKQFDILKSEGHCIVGYVIMPNHVHALIAFKKMGKSVNQRIGTMKRFLAYQLIERLKKANETGVLQMLYTAVNNTEKKKWQVTCCV